MSKEILLHEIEIPQYIRSFKVSNSIRPKYYEMGGKQIPVRCCDKAKYKSEGIRVPDGENYMWKTFPVVRQKVKREVTFLVDKDGNRVIANPKKVGDERWLNINGQAIYNGAISRFQRNAMIGAIKDQMRPIFETVPTIYKFPLRFDVGVFDTFDDYEYGNGKDWDVGNRYFPYDKVIPDLLQELGIIPDDQRLYITEPPHPIFFPISHGKDRKLVIRIYQDTREWIKQHEKYKHFFI